MTMTPLPPLREVIARHGLAAQKSLGQNFLLDLNLTGRIARSAGSLDDHDVLEVGPGPGGLTRALLEEGARRVVAIERDRRCIAALEEVAAAYPGRLEIVEGDALATDMKALVKAPARIIANLPYNIATPLLVGWLQTEPWPPWYDSLTLMFQREVAERIVAQPGGKAYGRLAVLAQWRARPRILFDIDRRAFTPPSSGDIVPRRARTPRTRRLPRPIPVCSSVLLPLLSDRGARCFGRASSHSAMTHCLSWRQPGSSPRDEPKSSASRHSALSRAPSRQAAETGASKVVAPHAACHIVDQRAAQRPET